MIWGTAADLKPLKGVEIFKLHYAIIGQFSNVTATPAHGTSIEKDQVLQQRTPFRKIKEFGSGNLENLRHLLLSDSILQGLK